MLIYIALFGGAAFGVLIAYLIIVERELREKNRRLAELESRSGDNVEATGQEQEKEVQPSLPGIDTPPELVELNDENARLLSQVALLKEERDAQQGKIQSLENSQEKLPDMERQLADLKENNARLLGEVTGATRERDEYRERIHELEGLQEKFPEMERQLADLREKNTGLLGEIAELAKDRDKSQARVRELENSQGNFPKLEKQLADMKEENTRLSSQIADLRSMILEKIETHLAGLNGLYQEVERSSSRH
jgi:DNA repair ATPase RecN